MIFLHTLGELEGFIDTQCCDVAMVVGDFNVDFDRDGPLAKLLNDFIIELDLSVCDLSFRDKVKFTYERDDGACHSWIDHVLCSQSHSSLINPRRACARVTVVNPRRACARVTVRLLPL